MPHKRPGPLAEWPLEHFLLKNRNATNKTGVPHQSVPPQKRARSPTTPQPLLSPAKRRILYAEGLMSPEGKKLKEGRASASSPARRLTFNTSTRQSEPSKDTLIVGDDVDAFFRSPNTANNTPSRPIASTSRLEPSPELVPPPSSKTRQVAHSPEDFQMSDYFCTEAISTSTQPIMIPREIPIPSEVSSIHYPGFVVHIDTHMPLPMARSRTQVTDLDAQEVSSNERKENLVPRRIKATKAISDPIGLAAKIQADAKLQSHLSDSLLPTLSKHEQSCGTSSLELTPKNLAPNTFVRTPEAKALMRKLMAAEMDCVQLNDNEDEDDAMS